MRLNSLKIACLFLTACKTIAAESTAKIKSADSDFVLREYQPYTIVNSDETFHRQFINYLEWIVSLDGEGSDAFYTLDHINSSRQTIDGISTAYHEKVEFLHWLELGHSMENIKNAGYYQRNYKMVYPTGHLRAVEAEMNLLRFFARNRGITPATPLAYALTSPMREKRKRNGMIVPAERMARRLVFNLAYHLERTSEADLQSAIQAYEVGGYSYEDKNEILNSALNFTCNEECWCNSIKQWQSAGLELNQRLYKNCL